MQNDIKEIGGYFCLEISNKNQQYHKNAIALNSCRNAFEYILKVKKPLQVYIPYYNCGVMLEPLIKTNTKYKYYKINKNFDLLEDITLKNNEYILYVNYFGIKNRYIEYLINKFGNHLIIDNSQSFFSKYTKDIYAIYSPRKFFGVSDGSYLLGNLDLIALKRDNSVNRMKHLLGRIEDGASKYYNDYKTNDNSLKQQPIMQMSKITETILRSIDYEQVKEIRNENFKYLHKQLKKINKINIDLDTIDGAMVYPLCLEEKLKNILIKNKIYIATYWSDVLNIRNVPKIECYLTKNIISLPIDQRYNLDDMKRIVKVIKKNLSLPTVKL